MNANDYLSLYQNLTANGYTGTMEKLMQQILADQDPRAVEQNIGMVTAYAYAVSKGYTGTEDEFAELMANVGITLQEIETAIDTFVDETVPAAVQQVMTTGETQVRNVNAAGAEQLRGIAAEGTQQRQNVTTAGEQQVTAINNKGTEQIDAVQAKGDQVIASIPADYTELAEEVSDVKSTLTELDEEYSGSKPFPITDNLVNPSAESNKGVYWQNGIKYTDEGTSGNTPKMVSVKITCEAEKTYYNALYNVSDGNRRINSDITYINYFSADNSFISFEAETLELVNGVYQGKFITPPNTAYAMISYVAYANVTDNEKSYNAMVIDTPVPNTYIEYVVYNLHTAKSEIENLETTINANISYKETVHGISEYTENNGIVGPNGTWGGGAGNTAFKHIVVPCDADFTFFEVTASSEYYLYMTAVTDYVKHNNHGDPIQNMTQYWMNTVSVGAGKTVSGMIPKDSKYLLISSVNDNKQVLEDLTITKINKPKGESYNVNNLRASAFNVRDFGYGPTEGCPSSDVDTNIPLWKNLISKWLNADFTNIAEWRTKFDEDNTIDAYDTLFKQFYPYKYEVVVNGGAIQCILSKHECIFTDLSYYGDVNRLVPMLITTIGGKSVAFVGWIQSSTDTVANREKAYRNAATILGTFDAVILAGDFNTEVGLGELEELTDRGYTLGNGGYWGTINTWGTTVPTSPNDNIATKGIILELFEASNDPISSDHLPVRAKICM